MWEDVNRGGVTAFIEDGPAWAAKTLAKLSGSRVYVTEYGTKLSDWISLLDATDRLELDLPEEVTSRRWDVIVVDGPAGYDKYTGREAPGRMKSIYMASNGGQRRRRVRSRLRKAGRTAICRPLSRVPPALRQR